MSAYLAMSSFGAQRGRFASWLVAIAKNRCLNAKKRPQSIRTRAIDATSSASFPFREMWSRWKRINSASMVRSWTTRTFDPGRAENSCVPQTTALRTTPSPLVLPTRRSRHTLQSAMVDTECIDDCELFMGVQHRRRLQQ